ncbi:MAG: hypothetical protein KatS3mg103_0569 [Phycisphaerales bacterium]|nr:MAG: hypothetical protein KatS3mg103_0569 [Phycisphaerales bacterium]
MPRPTRTPTAVTNLRSVLGQAASALLIASAILATACADSDRAATSAKPSASPSATPTARPSSGPAAAGSGQGSGAPSAGTAEPIEPVRWHGSRSIVVDGDVADWPQDVAAVADEHWLYLRFMLDGPIRTLQGMDTPVAIWIDADGDPKTGTPIERPTVQGGLGADLEIVFSPRDPDAPRVGQGVLIRLYRPDGSAQRLTHDALDMHFAPTHAAPWYELRLSRAALANLGTQGPGPGRQRTGRRRGGLVRRTGPGPRLGRPLRDQRAPG